MSDSLLSEFSAATSRRKLLTRAGMLGAGVVGAGLLGRNSTASGYVLSGFGPKGHAFEVRDADIANFALNLEYLEAEFYLRGAFGTSLADGDISGVGTPGGVTGGTQVNFTNSLIRDYAAEIADDELNHVKLLREVLGNRAVARPEINFTDAFNNAAIAAGLITAGQSFDPFANETNFLLGAFVFEDVGVTAYHGACAIAQHNNILQAASGILAVEAYHAGAIRATLAGLAQSNPSIYTIANGISALRESASAAADGVTPTEVPLQDTTTGAPFIVAADSNSIAFSRSFAAVLNIVYLGGSSGAFGFFPNKLNGRIA